MDLDDNVDKEESISIRLLLTSMDFRLKSLELKWDQQESRVRILDTNQQNYANSVGEIRVHFDARLMELFTSIEHIERILQEETPNGPPSVVGSNKEMMRWMAGHQALHDKTTDTTSKFVLDVVKAVLILILGIAAGWLGAKMK